MDAVRGWAVAGLVTALLASGCSGAQVSQAGAPPTTTQTSVVPTGEPVASGASTPSAGTAASVPIVSVSPSAKAALRPSVTPVDRRSSKQRNQPFVVNGIAVVSAKHLVNGSFKPKVTGSYPLAPVAAKAFAKLQKAVRKVKLRLFVVSGYRSHASQAALYRHTLAIMGRAHTVKYVARPGSSEHQTGLALDLGSPSGRGTNFDRTPEWRWLRAHAQDYGFVLRYPKGRTKVTGIAFEPWHWRYVGVAQAKAIRALGANMTIEQYLRLA